MSQPKPAQALEVAWWPIERPIPYARNARVCDDGAVAAVAASIAEYGWRQPLVVDERGVILAGHTRLLAARKLGLSEVPVHVAAGLTAAQAKAFRLMDNKSHEGTSWDLALLPLELEELLGMAIDPALTGFSSAEIAALLASPGIGMCDPDEVPAPPAVPISKPGDLWCCGKHRLLCADATEPANVERLMSGERAMLMAFDPPYGVSYDGGNHPQTWAKTGKRISSEAKTRHWDDYREAGELEAFYTKTLQAALRYALAERPVFYQWFAMTKISDLLGAWRACDLLAHQTVIWHKSRAVLGRSDFMYDFEPCMYGWRKGQRPPAARRPPASATAVWEVSSVIEDGAGGQHPTQKPVELVRRPIEWHTRPGECIYEPFLGSGTALIAAEMTGRVCCAIELSPVFVDTAVTRWERFTGKKAVRDVAGH